VFVRELDPSVVMFDRFMMEEQFGWRVSETVRSLIIRHRRFALLAGSSSEKHSRETSFVEADLLVEEVAKREIASILRCDLSLMISEYEMQLLTEIFKIDSSLLFYLPLLLEEISNADICCLHLKKGIILFSLVVFSLEPSRQ
jgi:hypothetical protein